MKKFVALILALVLCMGATAALAAGELKVTEENFIITDSYSKYGYLFAKVENVGDQPIRIDDGVLEIFDESGAAITTQDYLSTNDIILKAGEYTYVMAYDDMDKEAAPADYRFSVLGKSDTSEECRYLDATASLELDVIKGFFEYNYMIAHVTNNTEQTAYGMTLVLAVRDAEGKLICVEEHELLNSEGLDAGSSMSFRLGFDSRYIEYYDANGIVPATIEVLAYYEVDAQ